MAKLILDNLSFEQALALADWFEGQGEQDCSIWLEEQNVKSPKVDVQSPNWRVIDSKSLTVTLKCK